jgi:transcriptional regulator with XRE-family HTH domain
MDTEIQNNGSHIGRKIERIRHLRGMSQTDLGNLLGITKQAVSKIEQSDEMDDNRLNDVASALGVTVEGLKKFNEEAVLYNTTNYYENCGVKTSAVNNINNNHTLNTFPIDQVVELFEKLLDKERKEFELLKKRKG